METPAKKSWQARLSKGSDALTQRFVESISVDHRLAAYDIRGSRAHADMLHAVGLIDMDDRTAIHSGLDAIDKEIEGGRFQFDPAFEDIHMVIEHALIDRIGEPARRLHTGRSRNDQVSLDMRLWCRDVIDNLLLRRIRAVQRALVDFAVRSGNLVMPAYTHLQRAQPSAAASYLLSFCQMFERDAARLIDARKRVNLCPLGCGAASGSTLPLDRHLVADKLGFEGIVENSIDGACDRDYLIEVAACLALTAVHLSRLAEDWIVFCSIEFGFLRIDDAFCTGSSMMPQKRNPDILELVRGKSAGIMSDHQALLVMMKGLPLGYNRDMQEDKRYIFHAVDSTADCLEAVEAIAQNSSFVSEHVEAALEGGFLDATALAEYLVNRGTPFRRSHQIVGELVAMCEQEGLRGLEHLDLDQFQSICPEIEGDVFEYLGARNVARKYETEGAAGLDQARNQVEKWKQLLAAEQ
jgi:argininosuccinate lyase